MPKIEVGDYVSFFDNEDVLYRVLDRHMFYIQIKDIDDVPYWENISYVERVLKVYESKSIK